ncbi:MAG TPA: hypothetical protein VJ997_02780 [Longimicrobiales bacterium]|nr:hypothetical protein [Longimicrobiales bacterium]
MSTSPTKFFLLEIVPHASTVRAKRIANPDLGRLLRPEWWSKALWGAAGGRDPMPLCVRALELDSASAEDMMEFCSEPEPDETGQLELPLGDQDTDILLTTPQARVIDTLFLADASGREATLGEEGGLYWLRTESGRSRVNKKTVQALISKGLATETGGDSGGGVILTDLGNRVAHSRNS